MDNTKEVLLNFTTQEHKHYDRTVDFYWAIGLIGIALATTAFIFKDGLFGVLILIGFGLYGYVSWLKPKDIEVVITNKDITINQDIYQISKIDSYRILDIKGDKELILAIRRTYEPIVSVCIPNEYEQVIKNTLGEMVEYNDSIVPYIGRRFMARYKI